ncbi:hypothetical protein ACEWY4_006224 [Coilia grayii]|uniref:Zinc finger PHD-type domain-containing protein n=1 Tax=Coilia grayii TaxID=363190 RepID=A0ABD1KCY2_9TELE
MGFPSRSRWPLCKASGWNNPFLKMDKGLLRKRCWGGHTSLCHLREVPPQHSLQGPPNALYGVSDTGYMNSDLFLKWLERPLLLFMDQHEAHVGTGVVDFCRANQIEVVCLPSHTTHVLQPLDVSVYGPLKAAFTDRARCLGLVRSNLTIGKRKLGQRKLGNVRCGRIGQTQRQIRQQQRAASAAARTAREAARRQREAAQQEAQQARETRQASAREVQEANRRDRQHAVRCALCGEGGVLLFLQCDGWSLWYHAECVDVGVVPEGAWYCGACHAAAAMMFEIKKNNNNN